MSRAASTVASSHVPGGVDEALVGEQLAEQVGGVEERQEEVLEQVAALDPAAVLRAHRVVVQRRHVAADGGDVRRLDAAALGHLDEQQLDEVERQHALQQARLDALRAAAAGPGEQRRRRCPARRRGRRRAPATGTAANTGPPRRSWRSNASIRPLRAATAAS